MRPCTYARHDELRADRTALERETVFAFWFPDEDGDFEMRNCSTCDSSISDGTRRPVESMSVPAVAA